MTEQVPKLLRAAAKLVATDTPHGCCSAITLASEDFPSATFYAAKRNFRAVMRPAHEKDSSYWWAHPLYRGAEAKHARVIALLLAALIYEDGQHV